MSTIKSSTEHLTLNADGSGKDIKFQANGVEKASISSAGAFTSTSIDATKLSGNLPAIDGSSLTGTGVGVGQTWTVLTASRAVTTNYTNSTGKPIYVGISVYGIDGEYGTLLVDGVVVGAIEATAAYNHSQVSAVVPNSSIYSFTGARINTWSELR
jgi:hypothetical protein